MDRPIPYRFNGQEDAGLPVSLRALHYGDGLFETIRWQGGSAKFFDQHMQRLQLGCQRLKIPFPDPALLLRECRLLMQSNLPERRQAAAQLDRAVIKIIVSRGAAARGYAFDPDQIPDRLVMRYDYPDYPAQLWRQGIKTRVCQTRLSRNVSLAGLKHLNRLEQVMARSEWQDVDIHEGFLMDDNGLLVEGSQSNVFLVKDGILHTPMLEQCGVAGVIRECVIKLASDWQIPLKIAELPIDRLMEADEVFVTNSVVGVWPVAQIDQHKIAVGPEAQKFQAAIDKLMEDQ